MLARVRRIGDTAPRWLESDQPAPGGRPAQRPARVGGVGRPAPCLPRQRTRIPRSSCRESAAHPTGCAWPRSRRCRTSPTCRAPTCWSSHDDEAGLLVAAHDFVVERPRPALEVAAAAAGRHAGKRHRLILQQQRHARKRTARRAPPSRCASAWSASTVTTALSDGLSCMIASSVPRTSSVGETCFVRTRSARPLASCCRSSASSLTSAPRVACRATGSPACPGGPCRPPDRGSAHRSRSARDAASRAGSPPRRRPPPTGRSTPRAPTRTGWRAGPDRAPIAGSRSSGSIIGMGTCASERANTARADARAPPRSVWAVNIAFVPSHSVPPAPWPVTSRAQRT